MKNNRTCILCGTEYKYCGNCAEDSRLEPWHNIYDNNNCRTIFNTATDYCAGLLSKDEAISIFDSCDLSNKDSFNSSVLKVLNELYSVVTENETNSIVTVAVEENEESEKTEEVVKTAAVTKTYSQNNYKHKNKKKK